MDSTERLTQAAIDALDAKVDSLSRTDIAAFGRTLRELSRLCEQSGLLPTSYTLTEGIELLDDEPCSSGGFSDVWKGRLHGSPIALKIIRLHIGDREKVNKAFCREAVFWKRLSPSHIVPFLGISPRHRLCIAAEWMPNGDLRAYLEDFPSVDRVALIIDIAQGLEYMHVSGLIHGDLKSRNILVDDNHRARLSDFGLATMMLSSSVASATSSSAARGSLRYMAPELLDYAAESARATTASDIYAFGLVAWEMFSGEVPFAEIRLEHAVLLRVMNGARPPRPTNGEGIGLSDRLWKVIQDCWQQHAKPRPPISTVLQELLQLGRLQPDATVSKVPISGRSSISVFSLEPLGQLLDPDVFSPPSPVVMSSRQDHVRDTAPILDDHQRTFDGESDTSKNQRCEASDLEPSDDGPVSSDVDLTHYTSAMVPHDGRSLATAITDLRRRVVDWRGHSISRLGSLVMYGLIPVRRQNLVWEYSVYLFREAMVLLAEDNRFRTVDGKGLLELKDCLRIRYFKKLADTSASDEMCLTVELDDPHSDSFQLIFRARFSLETWKSSIEECMMSCFRHHPPAEDVRPHMENFGVAGSVVPPRAARRPRRRVMKSPTSIALVPGPERIRSASRGPKTEVVPPIKVLIVDDDPTIRTILAGFMRKKNINYDVANDGEQAVEKWKSGVFHLILMDIHMPIMDGIQSTKEIRRLERDAECGAEGPSSATLRVSSIHSSAIIVALTASTLHSVRLAALEAGCNDFLTKPLSFAWLHNKIIEWGSMKALQMWADVKAMKSISRERAFIQARPELETLSNSGSDDGEQAPISKVDPLEEATPVSAPALALLDQDT